MEVIGWYFLFALSTAIAAHLELIIPVMRELEDYNSQDSIVEYKYVSYFTFGVLNTLIAPLVFLCCVVPSMGQRFRIALVDVLRTA